MEILLILGNSMEVNVAEWQKKYKSSFHIILNEYMTIEEFHIKSTNHFNTINQFV